jgi:hypothetical protein
MLLTLIILSQLVNEQETVIEDLIILGRACPEPISDGRQTICTAGYSEKHGFIRLYPTRYDAPLKTWNIVRVPVERPIKPLYDGRPESWKIVGSKKDWDTLSEKVEKVGEYSRNKRPALIGGLVSKCVNEIIESRRTLGIIKPAFMDPYFQKQEAVKLKQKALDDSLRLDVKENYPIVPRLKYRCSECTVKKESHDQQILEWGAYEWIRKNPNEVEQLWDNYRINDPAFEKYLLVGNLYKYPKTFNIVSILRYKL